MIRANHTDKTQVVNILLSSFVDNQSVNYIIKQDQRRVQRIKSLMEYSFDVCSLFGEIWLSDDRKGCALIVYPEKKKTTLKSILLDAKLIISSTGLVNARKAMAREEKIKAAQPKESIYYLWFIGVFTNEHGNGIGTKLMKHIINQGRLKNRTICLETSTLKNIPWYQKLGFTIYHQLDLGYNLYFLKCN
jgi:hypothetical protein